MAKMIRNMQVPAYCPVDLGVQAQENRGVVDDVKNTIPIESIPIMSMDGDVDIGIDMLVELGMAIPDIPVAVAVIDIESMFMVVGY